jgi:hypothetical protein
MPYLGQGLDQNLEKMLLLSQDRDQDQGQKVAQDQGLVQNQRLGPVQDLDQGQKLHLDQDQKLHLDQDLDPLHNPGQDQDLDQDQGLVRQLQKQDQVAQ